MIDRNDWRPLKFVSMLGSTIYYGNPLLTTPILGANCKSEPILPTILPSKGSNHSQTQMIEGH